MVFVDALYDLGRDAALTTHVDDWGSGMSATSNGGKVPLQRTPENTYGDAVPNPGKARAERFAKLIYDARTQAGITQDDLADQSGLNRSTIIRWEAGETSRPEPDQVRAVCRVLGVDPRRAAVALGFLTEEEAGGQTEARIDPRVEEVLRLLESGQLPTEEVDR